MHNDDDGLNWFVHLTKDERKIYYITSDGKFCATLILILIVQNNDKLLLRLFVSYSFTASEHRKKLISFYKLTFFYFWKKANTHLNAL